LDGLNSSEVDSGVLSAFQQLTADTLGVDVDTVNITGVTDTTPGRRLGLGSRTLTGGGGKGVKISFVILVVLEKSSHPSNATALVVSYDTLLSQKFVSSSTGGDLISLAILKGSTIPSGTVVTLAAPTVNYNYLVIIVKTGAPTASPVEQIGGGGDDDDSAADMTPIIIGVAVGGGVLLIALFAALYYFTGGGKGASKIEPR
jgi:hypothetical protein